MMLEKLKGTQMKRYAIIFAADLPDAQSLLNSVKAVANIVDGVKIGVPSIIKEGATIIERINELIENKPILIDLKIADIGFKSPNGWEGANWKIIRALENTPASHVTVHGFPGPASMVESIAASNDYGLQALILPLMSHQSAGLFFQGMVTSKRIISECASIGISIESIEKPEMEITEAIIFLADKLGASGFIGPATRPDDLKRYRELSSLPVWAPGFGRQDRLGRSMDEQFRQWAQILGPDSAAIVGSTIFKAKDMARAAQEIIEIRDMILTNE